MVMFWAVQLFLGVDERLHLCAYSECVEVSDVEDLELGHDGLGVAARGYSADEADDSFLGFDEWLEVSFLGVSGAPDGYVADEMGVDQGVVQGCHGREW